MDPNWAAENLQVIRTLMERSAIYRRALAPIMLLLGILGLLSGFLGWTLQIASSRGFVLYWMGISLVGITGAYFMVRRQSLRENEPFWSPPTRRVTQALLPALVVGCVTGFLIMFPEEKHAPLLWLLPPLWMALYGCAIHAAGFFMQRGIRLFGWLFIAASCLLFLQLAQSAVVPPLVQAHLLMGGAFGGFHLAYGIYLYFTEPRKNEA
ncbi:MAG: hypothetical protein AB1813_22140 [Verrucomicrobiota bacterium]|jgi:hypothetical protein